MANRRRIAGAAAGCAVAVATLLGTPAVSAQDACIQCDPGQVQPGDPFGKVEGAFIKIGDTLFHKVAAPEDQFHKVGAPIGDGVGGVVYPGNTDDVFVKYGE